MSTDDKLKVDFGLYPGDEDWPDGFHPQPPASKVIVKDTFGHRPTEMFDFSGDSVSQIQSAMRLLTWLLELGDPDPKGTAQWLLFEADSRESAEGPTLSAWREGPRLDD